MLVTGIVKRFLRHIINLESHSRANQSIMYLYKHYSEMTSLFFFKIKNYFLLLKMPQMIKVK